MFTVCEDKRWVLFVFFGQCHWCWMWKYWNMAGLLCIEHEVCKIYTRDIQNHRVAQNCIEKKTQPGLIWICTFLQPQPRSGINHEKSLLQLLQACNHLCLCVFFPKILQKDFVVLFHTLGNSFPLWKVICLFALRFEFLPVAYAVASQEVVNKVEILSSLNKHAPI